MLLRPASLAVLAALTLATPAALAHAGTPQIAAEHVAPATLAVPAPAAPAADARLGATYAQREATHQDAAKFNGGSVVVIGVSGGALIVILILLLILI